MGFKLEKVTQGRSQIVQHLMYVCGKMCTRLAGCNKILVLVSLSVLTSRACIKKLLL